MDPKMEEKLKEYARLLVRVGLNVEQGQTLVISSPVECAGFARLCARLGLDFQPERDCYRVYYGKGRLQSCIQETTKIADQTRYDSLFLTTDDLLLLVLEVLNDQQRYTPGSFGLITLNSQNNALSGNARVNAISSATDELATSITDRILAHADGLIDQLPTIAITPTIHEGETLCIRQRS